MFKKLQSVFLLTVLVQGCASPFSTFYHDKTGGMELLTKSSKLVLPTGEPQILRGGDQEQDSLKMTENNYGLVGYSSFNGSNVNENGAIAQAKKVHASVVILYSKYARTESGYTPLTLPDTTTSSTTLHANAYGTGGYASYSGTAKTTTYGTKTTYIPYSIDISDYLATYWVKMKSHVFGVLIEDLTPVIKQQIGSNKGVLVYAVVKGSPAFEADILKGDVLRQIGDVSVFDDDSMTKAIAKYEGKEVIVVLFRGDKEIHKSIKMGAGTRS